MCDCYSHKCECCEELIPVHIADFNYPREDFKVWCKDHIDNAERGSVVFELINIDKMVKKWAGFPVGWKCVIKGPGVGLKSGGGNHPNTVGDYKEYEM